MTSSGRRLALCVALLAGCLAAPVPVASAPAIGPDPRSIPPTFRLAPETPGISARDVPLGAGLLNRPIRTRAVDLVGVTWRGEAGPIRVRTRSERGWTRWQPTEVLQDGPDASSAENHGTNGTDLLWVGEADRVEVDVLGRRPVGLTLALIDVSAVAPVAAKEAPAPRAAGASLRPRVLGRDAWRADPRLRDGRPAYNRTIQQLHIHHTVSSNDYAPADVPGLIRGMYRYHTVNLGWSDIGYNFLVDRFGRIWTGRAGGIERAVRGAHTLGFNSTSTGVAVIGNFEVVAPSRPARTALVHLAAWKLARHHRNPLGKVTVFSHGSDRFAAGARVRLPVIDGHRDTNQTACPGALLYERLPDIRRRTAKRIERYATADAALYRAKKLGRDRVATAGNRASSGSDRP